MIAEHFEITQEKIMDAADNSERQEFFDIVNLVVESMDMSDLNGGGIWSSSLFFLATDAAEARHWCEPKRLTEHVLMLSMMVDVYNEVGVELGMATIEFTYSGVKTWNAQEWHSAECFFNCDDYMMDDDGNMTPFTDDDGQLLIDHVWQQIETVLNGR